MLTVKEKGLLIHISDYCRRIESKINGLTKESLSKNKDTLEIICFNILQIGELAKKFTPEFIHFHKLVPWKDIKGMRDRIVHGYGDIRIDKVYDTVINDILPLENYCETLLKDEDFGK